MSVFPICRSSARWEKLTYVWEIDDFIYLREIAKHQALTGKDRIDSPQFGDDYNGHWHLTVFPAGTHCDGKHIAVYLFSDCFSQQVATFEITVLNNDFSEIENTKQEIRMPRVFTPNESSWGWLDYLNIEQVVAESDESINESHNNLLQHVNLEDIVDDSDTFTSIFSGIPIMNDEEVFVESRVNSSQLPVDWKKTTLVDYAFDGKLCLKVDVKIYHGLNHYNGFENVMEMNNITSQSVYFLGLDINSFNQRGLSINVTEAYLCCDELKIFVSPLILAARSLYFRHLLTNSEHSKEVIYFDVNDENMDHFVLENAVSYICHANCLAIDNYIDNESSIVKLFIFGDKYGIDSLRDVCISILIASLSDINVLDFLVLGEHYSCEQLFTAASHFLKTKSNMHTLAKSMMKRHNEEFTVELDRSEHDSKSECGHSCVKYTFSDLKESSYCFCENSYISAGIDKSGLDSVSVSLSTIASLSEQNLT